MYIINLLAWNSCWNSSEYVPVVTLSVCICLKIYFDIRKSKYVYLRIWRVSIYYHIWIYLYSNSTLILDHDFPLKSRDGQNISFSDVYRSVYEQRVKHNVRRSYYAILFDNRLALIDRQNHLSLEAISALASLSYSFLLTRAHTHTSVLANFFNTLCLGIALINCRLRSFV